MITEEYKSEKACLFCANDYHLEMILLPYIKERLETTKFIIFTENDLEETIDILLTKVNLNNEIKEEIKKIGWKNENKIESLKRYVKNNEKVEVIINGELNYINDISNNIKELITKNVKIIDCFHVGDSEVDISQISLKYKQILNTQQI